MSFLAGYFCRILDYFLSIILIFTIVTTCSTKDQLSNLSLFNNIVQLVLLILLEPPTRKEPSV